MIFTEYKSPHGHQKRKRMGLRNKKFILCGLSPCSYFWRMYCILRGLRPYYNSMLLLPHQVLGNWRKKIVVIVFLCSYKWDICSETEYLAQVVNIHHKWSFLSKKKKQPCLIKLFILYAESILGSYPLHITRLLQICCSLRYTHTHTHTHTP